MKVSNLVFVCLSVCLTHQSSAQFNPLLNVESCTKDKLVVSTFNAADNGLIYIQGQGESCKQTTVTGVGMYEFDFQQCGIQWEMLFKIIIQKNAGYQTGADKQIPIFCVADRSDLLVTNVNNALDKTDDGGLNMTIKPSAFMTFYKVVSEEEVMGKEVKLTDVLIMAIQLDSEWSADFDIKAEYCIASDIVIIQDFCATDPDLFPNFSRLKTGYLISQFGAFRATNLEGGSVEMNFTCVLEVCKDACEETNCNGTPGWGRKRREVTQTDSNSLGKITVGASNGRTVSERASNDNNRNKRQAEAFDIDVGGKVNIVEKYSEIQIVTKETFCLNVAVFILSIVVLSASVLGLGGTSVILYRKWASAQALAKKTQIQRVNAVRHPHRGVKQSTNPKLAHPFNQQSFDEY